MPKVVVNGEVLRWARETSGLDLETAAKKLKIVGTKKQQPVERLRDLETGSEQPTRRMLVQMEKTYRRPLLTFYLPAPPKKANRGKDFRTLPGSGTALDEPVLDALIRDVHVRQSIIKAALEELEEAEEVTFVGSISIATLIASVVNHLRSQLALPLDEFRKLSTHEKAFALLRSRAESLGVFVLLIGDLGSHHTKLDSSSFRGYALSDKTAPFIVINHNDSRPAWIFSLLHELVHIGLGETGISGGLPSSKRVEKFCNEVAARYLLPKHEVAAIDVDDSTGLDLAVQHISSFAKKRHLSGSMVSYCLFREKEISEATWHRTREEFRRLWQKSRELRKEKKSEQGPDYYVVRKQRLGASIVAIVGRMLRGKVLTTCKASQVLGIKPQNVGRLITNR